MGVGVGRLGVGGLGGKVAVGGLGGGGCWLGVGALRRAANIGQGWHTNAWRSMISQCYLSLSLNAVSQCHLGAISVLPRSLSTSVPSRCHPHLPQTALDLGSAYIPVGLWDPRFSQMALGSTRIPHRRLGSTLIPHRTLGSTLIPHRRLGSTLIPHRRLGSTRILLRDPCTSIQRGSHRCAHPFPPPDCPCRSCCCRRSRHTCCTRDKPRSRTR